MFLNILPSQQGVANQDHTTLLLNCYTKLKNVKKLEQVIYLLS